MFDTLSKAGKYLGQAAKMMIACPITIIMSSIFA